MTSKTDYKAQRTLIENSIASGEFWDFLNTGLFAEEHATELHCGEDIAFHTNRILESVDEYDRAKRKYNRYPYGKEKPKQKVTASSFFKSEEDALNIAAEGVLSCWGDICNELDKLKDNDVFGVDFDLSMLRNNMNCKPKFETSFLGVDFNRNKLDVKKTNHVQIVLCKDSTSPFGFTLRSMYPLIKEKGIPVTNSRQVLENVLPNTKMYQKMDPYEQVYYESFVDKDLPSNVKVFSDKKKGKSLNFALMDAKDDDTKYGVTVRPDSIEFMTYKRAAFNSNRFDKISTEIIDDEKRQELLNAGFSATLDIADTLQKSLNEKLEAKGLQKKKSLQTFHKGKQMKCFIDIDLPKEDEAECKSICD